MGMPVTRQRTTRRRVIRDCLARIRTDHIQIETEERASAPDSTRSGRNTVGTVADRTRETILYMPRMFSPTRAGVDVRKIVTFCAERIRRS